MFHLSSSPQLSEPSPERVAELLAATVEEFVSDLEGAVREMVDAAIKAAPLLARDQVLEDSVRASIQAMSSRWVDSERRRPGEPVPTDIPPAAIDFARDLVRHGVDLQHLLTGYRAAENVSCRRWLIAAAEAVSSEDLAFVAVFGQREINRWVDGSLDLIVKQIEQEREELLGGALARRLETVSLIMEDAPISEDAAGRRLAVNMGAWHLGLVIATTEPDHEQGILEKAARRLAQAMDIRAPLILTVSTTSAWMWLSSSAGPIDVRRVREAANDVAPSLMVTAGSSSAGLAGFRRTHREAVAARRFLDQAVVRQNFTAYEDVRVAVLATSDKEAATLFVADTLGELRDAEPVARETLRVFLQEGASTSRAAARLFTHRNTVLNRLERAERLLPQPLEGRHLNVALALELRR